MNTRPRIAVVGCGALGSFYGAHLSRAGHDVHFLLRSDYEVVRERGVQVCDAHGGFVARPSSVAREPGEIGVCDWVLVGLKTTANGQFASLLGPLMGPRSAVLTLQNGLGNEDALGGLFGLERVLGGLCIVCLNRVAPGVIDHLAHGRIVMGEAGGPATERARRMAGWFHDSGVPCDVVDNLEQAHWEKLVWNIPFNGLGVAAVGGIEAVRRGRLIPGQPLGSCHSTKALLGDPGWASWVRGLMAETIAAAQAQGLQVKSSMADEQIARTMEIGDYKASTLIDYERGLPLEIESLFAEPLRRANAAGVEAPRLRALCSLLRELDQRRT